MVPYGEYTIYDGTGKNSSVNIASTVFAEGEEM